MWKALVQFRSRYDFERHGKTTVTSSSWLRGFLCLKRDNALTSYPIGLSSLYTAFVPILVTELDFRFLGSSDGLRTPPPYDSPI
jgi:hypothetical protein